MEIPWFIAWHFLREYRAQAWLTVSAVAVGVAVMIFLSALITGLQESLIEQTLGTQAHVTLRPAKERARPVLDGSHLVRSVQPAAQRVRSIPEWQSLVARSEADRSIVAAAPVALGDAFARRGQSNRPVVLLGTEPELFDRVIGVSDHLASGRYVLNGQEALIGAALAVDLGVSVGDKIRIETPGGRSTLLTVAALFDLGNQNVNSRWVLTPLRTAQTLLDLPGGVNIIYLRIREIFEAERLARRLRAGTELEVDSWMESNRQLLTALRSQSSSSYTIQFFIFLAVAMGIASVLVVSVVQRTPQIGILRAMGISRKSIFLVFLMQGALVGLGGSAVGSVAGALLSSLFSRLAQGPDGASTFPMALSLGLFLWTAAIATLTGVAAASFPARRAAAMDPVEAIRHG